MRLWQATIPTDPPTHVWLEHPGNWMRTQYAIEQGNSRRIQVREPAPEELRIPGTERRDLWVCYSCRQPIPEKMIAKRNARELPICRDCVKSAERTRRAKNGR